MQVRRRELFYQHHHLLLFRWRRSSPAQQIYQQATGCEVPALNEHPSPSTCFRNFFQNAKHPLNELPPSTERQVAMLVFKPASSVIRHLVRCHFDLLAVRVIPDQEKQLCIRDPWPESITIKRRDLTRHGLLMIKLLSYKFRRPILFPYETKESIR